MPTLSNGVCEGCVCVGGGGGGHGIFDPRLADIVNQFVYFPLGGTRDSNLTNIDCR